MKDKNIQKYSEILKKFGVEHKVVEHPELHTPLEVQGFLGFTLADGLSTLIMKADGGFIAVIRRDDTRLDLARVKSILKVTNLRMAKPEEFKKITGLPLGAARVYNPSLKTLLDEKLFEKKYLTGGTGSFTVSFRYKSEDLKRLPDSQIVDITEGQKETEGLKRVLSGIRATGRLHLGNYLGAVKGFLELQDNSEYETFYMVADLHTLTTPYDKEKLQENTRNVVLDYLAAGLAPEKSTIFVQSEILEHTYLAYLFSTVATIARMQHLPTYKEKVTQYPQANTMALLNYPVLMAADILIYKASLVPVGIDQEPHLEVTREVARKMNEAYGTDFPEPKRFATKGEYIPSLTGEGKMSKSVEGSYINLTDDLETIRKKLASAPTDSGQGKKVPTAGGVANLLKFVELFEGEDARKKYEQAYSEKGIAYSELKEELTQAIYKELEPIQKRRAELEKKPEYVDKVLKKGAEKARKVAEETVKEVKGKMGLN